MTFLYDIGRVLLDFEFEPRLARLMPAGVEDGEARLARLLERKDDFEAGRIPADEWTAWCLEVLGSDADAQVFRETWQDIFTPNEPMWEVVRRLKEAGHRLILFSNTNAIHCPWVFEKYPQFSLFDEAVLSFEAGEVKPHAPIYEYAVDRHALVPEETLYIDDLAQNIETGKAFGFHCWQYDFNDHASFEEWLAGFSLFSRRIAS